MTKRSDDFLKKYKEFEGFTTVRDPNRIDELLERLKTVWKKQPDLRLGQIIINAGRFTLGLDDVFYVEDEQLVKAIESELEPKGNTRKSC